MTPNATHQAMPAAATAADRFWKKVDAVCGVAFTAAVFGGGVIAPIVLLINGLANN